MTDSPVTNLGFARVDHVREEKWGLPEAVLGLGKTPDQIRDIVQAIVKRNSGPVLVTRTTSEVFETVAMDHPGAEWHPGPGLIRIVREPIVTSGKVGVVAAGTSDLPVAEEAALTAQSGGSTVDRIYDVGVAGLHRLLAETDRLETQDCLVVVAGMEGALPTVVAGLIGKPVVAVPTSVGYGASLGGIAALLGMLNSCAPQVVCVNIDNGFGAGFFASLVCRK